MRVEFPCDELVGRRAVLTGALAWLGLTAASPFTEPRQLAFEIRRNGGVIGHHSLVFSDTGAEQRIAITARMNVNLGPLPVFRYRHQATEVWRDGAFAELHSATVTNGKHENLAAIRGPLGLDVRTDTGRRTLAANYLPLTHWNPRALTGPLFNPQTGAPMRVAVARHSGTPIAATRYALEGGDIDISDWYDDAGVWTALRAKVRDGSIIDYRRTA